MRKLPYFNPIELMKEFDEFLSAQSHKFEAVLIGSGAMNILGLLESRTVDLDILDPKIPPQILKLALDFRELKLSQGVELQESWINNGPSSLLNHLPKDWSTRVQPLFKGKALTLVTLGRQELFMDKLWGYCDTRTADKTVILNLRPTRKELKTAAEWVKKQEGNPEWPKHVDDCVADIEEALAYEE
ncbi:MAG: hypothetical protein EA369_05070 [Bradymonadales bacterium]|nr:MAG: hypothetical protein EA369_05070 [Bradymonadales bacterium]